MNLREIPPPHATFPPQQMASLWGFLTRTYDGYILPIRFPYNRTCGNWYRDTLQFLWPMGPKQSMVDKDVYFPTFENPQQKSNGIHGCTVNIPDIYQAVPNRWVFLEPWIYQCMVVPFIGSNHDRAACLDSTIL